MDSTSPLDVKVEWDKNERKRTRNRINQRNYRRRKTEHAKEASSKEPLMGDASDSPVSFQAETPDSMLGGSDRASQRQVSTDLLTIGNRPMPWLTSKPSSAETSDSMTTSANAMKHTGDWLRYSNARLAARNSSNDECLTHTMDPGNWQRSPDLQSQYASLSSAQQNDLPWSGAPDASLSHPPPATSTNASLYSGKTTLHLAAESGNSQSVQILLSYGADPNVKDSVGSTALHVAVAGGYVDIVIDLIGAGCDLDATDLMGRTALHFAAERNHSQIMGLLLRAGGDPNAQIPSH